MSIATATLDRPNDLFDSLIEGLESTGRCLLDVGCGGRGELSAAAAARGYRVTACTNRPEDAASARTLAAIRHVECRFVIGDIDALPFAPASFDVVVNQETWSHSRSKAAYLKAVRRLLRPGGVFRCIDLALGDPPASPHRLRQYQAVCDGFRVPSLVSQQDAGDYLTAAGFTDVAVVDLTAKVKPSALTALGASMAPRILTAIGLEHWLHRSDDGSVGNPHQPAAARAAFNRGLRSGAFRYLYISGYNSLRG